MQQDTLRNLVIACAIFIAVMWIGPQLLPKRLPPSGAPGQPAPTAPAGPVPSPPTSPDLTAGVGSTTTNATTDVTTGATTDAAAAETAFTVREADAEQTYAIGSEPANGVDIEPAKSPYRMRLVFSNVGASIATATLTDHEEDIGKPQRYKLLDTFEDGEGRKLRSLAIESVTIDNDLVVLQDKRWHSDGPMPTSDKPGRQVTFTIEIDGESGPVVRLARKYTLYEASIDSGRHDLLTDITVENLSGLKHDIIVAYRGGVGVRSMGSMRWATQFVDWGILRDGRIEGGRKNASQVSGKSGQPVQVYKPEPDDANARFSWAATANTYFTCTVAPLNADGTDNAAYISSVDSLDLDGSPKTTNDVTLRFVTLSKALDPHQTAQFPADVFIGDKDVHAFKSIDPYRQRHYYYQVSQGYGKCTFTWLVEFMVWLLNGFHAVVRDFGVAIIILVLIVRTMLHPITKKGQVNMVKMQKKMQEMAPKIEEIKKKYANDKTRLNQEMMKLNINPAGQILTCLPMMLQMPIWVALYISLSNNILIRHATSFVVPWVHDLSAQDALYTFSSPVIVPFLGWSIPSLNLLPLLVAVFMYTQQKLQPKPEPGPNMTEKQQQQQDMMKKMGPMMSVMMLLIFYKMPAGLNLYIMASSLFGTIEQKRIRTHIKEQEAAGTLLKTDPTPATPKKKGKPGFLERMQKRVDEAQKMQSKRQPKPKRRS